MARVLSFEQFISKTNEADLFGVTTSSSGNLPPGYDDSDGYEPEDERDIDVSKHKLKVIATDHHEFAILEDPDGKKYVYYFDSSQPDFQEDYMIYNDYTDDYEPIDMIGVQEAANDVPEQAYGFGVAGYDDGNKEIIELDEELTDDLIEQLNGLVSRDSAKREVISALEKIALSMREANESQEYGVDEEDESETDGKSGYEESETDETTEVMESEGIHPAIREKILMYLKDNPDATYAEAKKFIGEKIAGWKLSQEDFEEAKKIS